MADVRAADLPEGSIVAHRNHAFLKTSPGVWASTSGTYNTGDWTVDHMFNLGAQVVRHGYGEED